jgi:hypothetical protein
LVKNLAPVSEHPRFVVAPQVQLLHRRVSANPVYAAYGVSPLGHVAPDAEAEQSLNPLGATGAQTWPAGQPPPARGRAQVSP